MSTNWLDRHDARNDVLVRRSSRRDTHSDGMNEDLRAALSALAQIDDAELHALIDVLRPGMLD